MPRLARLDAPGVLHHVMGRGIERNEIFLNDEDRRDFIKRLEKFALEDAMDVYAWCLMPNHLHMICKAVEKTDLPDLLRDFKNFSKVSL